MSFKGHKHTPERRAKMSALNMGNQNFLGHRHTSEARAKMRAAHLGKKHAPETRKKISMANRGQKHPMYGKQHSPESVANMCAAKTHEVRKRISATLTGGKHTVGTLAKMSVAQAGPNNPRWLGGISREPYAWAFNAELKEEVRRRDDHQCQLCGVPQMECERRLPVHHIDYDKENSDPVNLIALCVSCNSKVNANREHWTAHFRTMAIKRDIAALISEVDTNAK